MNRKQLAEKLISAKSAKERNSLLVKYSNLADIGLAVALKESCYDAWTNDPTKAIRAKHAIFSLQKISSDSEIEAYANWISGIADLTKGKLDSALVNIDNSARIFARNENELEAAHTQIAKLYALALLGKYDEAFETGLQALDVFQAHGDELSAGKVEKNLGNLAARQGDETKTVKLYLSARKRFRKVGDFEELAMAENSLANSYAELNDFKKAERFYASALEAARKAKMYVTEAEIEASMGNLALFRGRYDDALRFLEYSRQKYETLEMPHQSAIAELEIADIYLELNLTDEAIGIYQNVSEQFHGLKLRSEEARARMNWGRAAAKAGVPKTAQKQLRAAEKLYFTEENSVGLALVKIYRAIIGLDQDNFDKSIELAEELLAMHGKIERGRHNLIAKWIVAETFRKTGRLSESNAALNALLEEATAHENQNIELKILNSLGNLALQIEDSQTAKIHFKAAISLVESLRAPLPAEEFRMAFLADKLAPFENLAKLLIDEHDFEAAFKYIEKAKARTLSENMEFESAEGKSVIPDQKHSKLREQLNWYYSKINRAEAGELEGLSVKVNKYEKLLAEHIRKVESTKRIKKSDARAFDPEALKNQLGHDRALIEFVNFDGNISAFLITDSTVEFFENLANETEITEILEGLHFQFGSLRFGSNHLEKFIPNLISRADHYLKRLYDFLVRPIESRLKNKSLVIIPAGILHYVPFSALKSDEKYLIEQHEIVSSPSAAVWLKLDQTPVRKVHNAMFFGFADEKIPLVDEEIRAIGGFFEHSMSFLSNDANINNYTKFAPDFDLLHIACHGSFRPENPLFSHLSLADGNVTARDIYAQQLKAELVTLSACETGLNKIFAGEEILGLARGFLSAGAKSLVLSLWTVNDEATAKLMKHFYSNLQRSNSISASLRKAQLKFIEDGVHPYFWSPFVLIGK